MIIRRNPQNVMEILIERRAVPPFKGHYCIPGGHVDYGETVESAAIRELQEETSLRANLVQILGVYSDPKRDPRGQRITTVFIGDCETEDIPKAADDAKTAEWINVDDLLGKKGIAFDHRLILEDYKRYLSSIHTSGNTFWSSKKER